MNATEMLKMYKEIAQPDNKTLLEYVWIDGMFGLRAKTKTVSFRPKSSNELPVWNFDGSSTGQADGSNADVYIQPVALYSDPFRGGHNKLVLCETVKYNGEPLPSNSRRSCAEVMAAVVEEQEPWFGIEQEYTLIDPQNKWPLGWPANGYPPPQGPYYCGIGTSRVFGRYLVESHYKSCLFAGIPIDGINAEVMPSQWEYQVGPSVGVAIGDDLWMSRYLLYRVAEDYGLDISLDPKPIAGDWNGCGAHTNYSTKAMRVKGGPGLKEIQRAIERLREKHVQHIICYDAAKGKDNVRRLTGKHETADINTFSDGVANRGASVRIPRQVAEDGGGYLEDRRPASNCDPYIVAEMLIRTTLLCN